MGTFHISAGVYTSEVDLTNAIPSVATSTGALAGVFRWGPVNERMTITSEKDLVGRVGKPTSLNPETFLTAASYLSYSGSLILVRAANTVANSTAITNSALNAVALAPTTTATNTHLVSAIVKNTQAIESASFDSAVFFAAKWPSALGNSLKISTVDNAVGYSSNVSLVPNTDIDAGNSACLFTVGSNSVTILLVPSGTGTGATTLAVANSVANNVSVGDYIKIGNSSIGIQNLQVSTVGSSSQSGANASITLTFTTPFNLSTNYAANNLNRFWEYYNQVARAPGTSSHQAAFGNNAIVDEVHVVVADQDGLFTGVPGTILEVFEGLSRGTDAKNESGQTIYYKNVLKTNSKYVWAASDLTGAATAAATALTNSSATKPFISSFQGGQDGQDENNVPLGVLATAYDQFVSADEVDISLIMQGVARGGSNGTGLANYIIGNICEVRKDCVALISPEKADVVNAAGQEVDNIIAFRNSLTNTSYAMLDSGYKWTYDKYNDVYRYIPLNGDIAGLLARTDDVADPWFSPGGYNRGQIKNVGRLAWNPSSVEIRDQLYKLDINPVMSSAQGQGTVLFGDKTLLGKTSAFNRINVRRLFIVLEKAIARASSALLFEINDAFTQAQFRNMVEPFLREVQGRRGITDFQVVCDDTNNTAEVVDANQFVGDIFIKPARSINTIQLNFAAVRTGVEFSEIVGAV